MSNQDHQLEQLHFPADFHWGAATSSHQIEGHQHNNWTEWEHQNADRLAKLAATHNTWLPSWEAQKDEMLDPQNYISSKAADHFNRWEQDLDLLVEMGLNSYRFSLEWSRIEPEPGTFNKHAIEFYQKLVEGLNKRGIEPFITLWHWTLPIWTRDQGGWANPKTVDDFAKFTHNVTQNGIQAKHWITINEPEIYTRQAYLVANWPPMDRNLIKYFRVIGHLIDGHNAADEVIKRTQPAAQVGIAKNNTYFQPFQNRWYNKLACQPLDWWWNHYFLNRIDKHLDFIGLNYYFHRVVDITRKREHGDPITDMGFEMYPRGIYHMLMDLKRYKKPIYVTENGIADHQDKRRKWFIEETLANVSHAISDGADVRGYFHWSLLDNFEWDKGFWPRFGLAEVDRKTLERKLRPSAYHYRDLIKELQF